MNNDYEERIKALEHHMLVLEFKDRWSLTDKEAFSSMRLELNKLKTLKALDKLERLWK